jgi:hypothetical protein
VGDELLLKDGSKLFLTSWVDVNPLIGKGLLKVDPAGKEVFHVSIMRVTRVKRKSMGYFESDTQLFDKIVYLHSKAFRVYEIYDLKDGTYLLTSFEGPLVIRINGDLESPFIDQREDLLVISAPEVRRMFLDAMEFVKRNRDLKCRKEISVSGCIDAIMTAKFRKLLAAKRNAR